MRIAASVLLLALPLRLAAQAVTPAPLQSGEVTFAMRATKVNDFVGHAVVARGEFQGTQLNGVTAAVEVRLTDMHTGIGLRDTHMRNAMKADSFPVIRFDLTGVEPGPAQGDTIPAVFNGRMTIHGVTKAVRVNGFVVIHGSTTEIASSFPLDMREYGIAPPSRFFGAIRVDPVTTVGVNLRFAQ
jgi:polyisoprenoid-binding protein YceI